jgi:hypothetical protein
MMMPFPSPVPDAERERFMMLAKRGVSFTGWSVPSMEREVGREVGRDMVCVRVGLEVSALAVRTCRDREERAHVEVQVTGRESRPSPPKRMRYSCCRAVRVAAPRAGKNRVQIWDVELIIQKEVFFKPFSLTEIRFV